jgi:hypothetical protein
MFDNNDKTAEAEGVTVSTVTSDEEDEHYVTQLPGSDYEMEFDEDQDWVEHNIPVPKQQLVACSLNDQRKAFLTITQGVI